MTIAWMTYVLLVGTLVALGAVAVSRAASLAGRPTRWAWAAGLLAIGVLAIGAPRARVISIAAGRTMEVRTVSAAPLTAPGSGVWSTVAAARAFVESIVVRAIAMLGARVPSALATSLLVAWISVSATLLALYLIVNARLSRARRRWPEQRLQGVAVRVSPAAGPAVIGMMRPEIVVPRSLLDRSADDQRLIVDHEREHLRARDHLLLGVACLAAIALPWHPAVWYLLARLRLAIELDCDARVLRRGVAPRSYGALLIDMASHGAGIRVGTLALADRPSHLERRLLAMRATRSRFLMLRVGTLGATAALLVLAACEAKVPTAADIDAMDVARAEKSAAEAGLMRAPFLTTTDFFVNGEKVSAELARAMEARNIGSMEVVKSRVAGGRDTIFVTTVDKMPTNAASATAHDPFEKAEAEQSQRQRKVLRDSSERLVAHVEGELARVRAGEQGGATAESKPRVMLRTPAGSTGDPVFMIDGRKVSSAEFATVRGEEIASISVYKGEQARKISSDPAAQNGVIMAVTRAHAKN